MPDNLTVDEREQLLKLLAKSMRELLDLEVDQNHPIYRAHNMTYAHHNAALQFHRRMNN